MSKRLRKCSAAKCGERSVRHGRCETHYASLRAEVNAKRPLPHIPPVRVGADSANWVGDQVSYSGMHCRLRAARGAASGYTCVDCGQPARHWSYDHRDQNEQVTAEGLLFSSKIDHYEPRCGACHKRFDMSAREAAA